MRRTQLLRKIYWLSGFLILFVSAFLISVIFLNPSSVGNRNFLWNFNIWAFIWASIFLVVLVLTFVLARNLIHLFFEYQTGQPGSRIKSKLVLTFVIFSLFPALIMFFVAFGLVNQNLTKWVSAPSEQLLESSQTVSDHYYEWHRRGVTAEARELIESYRATQPEQFDDLVRESTARGYQGLAVVFRDGSPALRSEDDLELPEATALDPVFAGGQLYSLKTSINSPTGIVDRGFVAQPLGEGRILVLLFEIPTSAAFHTARVEEANQVYMGLKGTLASLRIHYFLLLGMTTLAVVFAFVWLGSYIARRLTVPLEALAEGSRELAGGNLDHRVDVQAVDELGILVDSFNQMAEQLKQSRSELEKANRELQNSNIQLDQRSSYIEAVLQNIATGVVTVDQSEIIRTANQAALKMLQTTAREILSKPIRVVADRQLYLEFLEMKKRADLFGTFRKQVTIQRNDRQLYAAATITTSPALSGRGAEYLVVLDDLTELLRAEKFAAWQEVARRLAHEIRNPLTPIQLSAERIAKRFAKISRQLPASNELLEFSKVVEEGTRMIVSESRMLKNLLAEFSRFARLPICRPVQAPLHHLIDQSLSLHDGRLTPVRIEKQFDPRIDQVALDPEQIQRVFQNLIDNALDALVEAVPERKLTIRTSFNEPRESVSIEFEDTGPGISADDYEHLFLPYFSTKKRGTGLGLAIVRQIISEHNGFVRAEPNVPSGTRIVIEIPVHFRAAAEV